MFQREKFAPSTPIPHPPPKKEKGTKIIDEEEEKGEDSKIQQTMVLTHKASKGDLPGL